MANYYEHYPALWSTILFFETVTAFLGVVTTLPQLIKILKEKETKELNFFSFWVYHFGLWLWIFYSAFADGRNNWLSTIASVWPALLLNSVLMFYLYYFNNKIINFKKQKYFWIPKAKFFNKKMWQALAINLFFFISATIFFILYFTLNPKYNWGPDANLVLGLIFPAASEFSFLPQLIYSFRTKHWDGVSYWLFVVYSVNNVSWIVFYVLWIRLNDLTHQPGNFGDYASLVWQIISTILFGLQLICTIVYLIRNKKNQTFKIIKRNNQLQLISPKYQEISKKKATLK